MNSSPDILRVPLVWRVAAPVGPHLMDEYHSEFLGCGVERLFFYVWRYVCGRELRLLRTRLKQWYTEDLAAKPGSHKPLEARIGQYPEVMWAEEQAFLRELGLIRRIGHRYLVSTMPLAGGFLADCRYRYRFFGVGDEVWIGERRLGRGRDLS